MKPLKIRAGVAVLTLAFLGAFGRAAGAQPPKGAASKTAEDPALAKARATFEEGIKLVDVGDHDGARLRFEEVWKVLKEPAVVYNLARAEQLAGRSADAVVHFRTFLSLPDPRITPAMRERARQNYDALRKLVAFVLVDTDKGAKVRVDGADVEVAFGSPAVLMPGAHRISATVSSGKTIERAVVALPGGETAVSFRTTPCWKTPRPAVPATSRFVVSSGEACDD